MRIYTKPPTKKQAKKFFGLMSKVIEYDLVDIMMALAEEHGGTSPLYDAIEQAQQELE